MPNMKQDRGADQALGRTVNAIMFQQGLTRRELGRALNVTGPLAGRKLRGEVSWSISDILSAAQLLNVEPASLIPTIEGDTYVPAMLGKAFAVPSAPISNGYTAGDLNPEPAD